MRSKRRLPPHPLPRGAKMCGRISLLAVAAATLLCVDVTAVAAAALLCVDVTAAVARGD